MSAVDTALRVLQWSTAAEPGWPGSPGSPAQGAPPEGDLTDPRQLAAPPPDVAAAVTHLAARTAARLRLDGPAAAERRPVGAGAVVLAAAVGARGRPGPAAEAVRAVPPPRSLWDVLAHHAVVAPALRHCAADPALAGRLRDASPLTALLDRPTEAGEAAAELLLEDVLLAHPQGRRLVVTVYCEAPVSPGQARWRGQVLDRLRMTERELVLDVYEAALLRHWPEHRSLLDRARTALAPPPDLPAARPVAAWWAALARLERSHGRLVKARAGITRHYLAGVRLFRQAERLEAMTA